MAEPILFGAHGSKVRKKGLRMRPLFLCPASGANVKSLSNLCKVICPIVKSPGHGIAGGLDTAFIIGPIDPSRSAVLGPYGLPKRHG